MGSLGKEIQGGMQETCEVGNQPTSVGFLGWGGCHLKALLESNQEMLTWLVLFPTTFPHYLRAG